jgi:hypothetical protein
VRKNESRNRSRKCFYERRSLQKLYSPSIRRVIPIDVEDLGMGSLSIIDDIKGL